MQEAAQFLEGRTSQKWAPCWAREVAHEEEDDKGAPATLEETLSLDQEGWDWTERLKGRSGQGVLGQLSCKDLRKKQFLSLDSFSKPVFNG